MEQGFEVVEDRDGVGKGVPDRSRSRQELGQCGHVMSQSVIVFRSLKARARYFWFVTKVSKCGANSVCLTMESGAI
jgi:hypothetical protein